MFHNTIPRTHCIYCGFKLTDTEFYYYGCQCEICVKQDHERIIEWRKGNADKELDEIYGARNSSSGFKRSLLLIH